VQRTFRILDESLVPNIRADFSLIHVATVGLVDLDGIPGQLKSIVGVAENMQPDKADWTPSTSTWMEIR
jgi:hypothetical protein